MTASSRSRIEDEAVAWFVTLGGDEAGEADFVSFRDWLEASGEHRAAYDRVEQAWIALDEAAPEARHATPSPPARPARSTLGWVGAGLAAALALVAIAPQFTGTTETYQTAKGE